MPFQKGNQFGNRKGRKPLGDSLAEQIRASASKERRKQLFDRMWALAIEPHSDQQVRVKAAEWLAKHGWPDESRGNTTTVKAENGAVTVIHEHGPASS